VAFATTLHFSKIQILAMCRVSWWYHDQLLMESSNFVSLIASFHQSDFAIIANLYM